MPTDAPDAAPAQVLQELFDKAGAGDLEGVRDCLEEELLLFKIGRVKWLADLMSAVETGAQIGLKASYRLSDVITHADGDLACVSYRSAARLEFPDGRVEEPRWLENAVLRRTDRWRILFLHSSYEAQD